MNRLLPLRSIFAGCLAVFVLAAPARAAGPDPALLKSTVDQAIDFLKTTQTDEGFWTTGTNAGITGLVLTALLDNGVSPDDPVAKQALAHLETYIQPDGGIYFEKTTHKNYETCIAMMAFHKANADGRYTKIVDNAKNFLRGLQWDQGEGIESSDPAYGGFGYGSHKRPDLSNTQFLLEALKTAGVPSDDPAIQKALIFVSRTQNLETEHNTTPFAARINDGGFYYTPAAEGTSQAGIDNNGGLRSYGSMTYAGLKSMIYAGLSKDDVRVKAALNWLKKHYSIEQNPGLGKQGLYYYYHTFARTLAVMEMDVFEDAEGVKHDWRKELVETLAAQQKSNGSWLNEADRWMEGDPNLVTAYVLLALSNCK